VRLDPDEMPGDRKLTVLDDFRSSDPVSDWMGWSAGGWPYMPCSLGGRLCRLGVDTALALCNHSLTLLCVDVSMRRRRVE
jgi:hypothetical protein